MAEDIFKDLIPEEEKNIQNTFQTNTEFDDLIPEEERNIILENKFKLSDTPDDKYFLKEQGLFDDLIPKEEQD